MSDFLCKVYDKLYCFLGYADMGLILGYESGGKGCARISFYIRGAPPKIFFSLQSAFEMATPRARSSTILPAPIGPAQGSRLLPPVEPASPSPMSRTPSGLAR